MDSEEGFYYWTGGDGVVFEEEEDFYHRGGGVVMGFEEEGCYYFSGGDEVEEVAEDRGDEEPDYSPVSRLRKHYTILTEERIRQLQDNDISTVSNVLSVSRGLSCTLLCQNNWSLSSIYNEWFAGEGRSAREPVGILAKQESLKHCKICLETIKIENMLSAACGHLFCAVCWKTYITASINDGPGCLLLPCPEPNCKFTVGLDMVDSLAAVDDKEKFYRYLCRSYVECNRSRKWCPSPGCHFAVEFDAGGCDSYDVTCDCSYKFCWNCTEESHRPVDCKTVDKWIKKTSSEAENIQWILAYTKPCPKCHRAIEKNRGCNHMTCESPCEHQFCWVCLGPWAEHTDNYACNKYKEEDDNVSTDDENSRKTAMKHVERYTHYYERWDSNDKSRKRALANLNLVRNEHINMLAKAQEEPLAQLQFVTEAWEQIVECRRILKWTYAYGYYMSPTETEKMGLFGYWQGEAEAALERLHHCAEKEMGKYLLADRPSKDFKNFRSKLAGLTLLTRNYFETFVRTLENNLSEVGKFRTKTS